MKIAHMQQKCPEDELHPSIDFVALSKRVFDSKELTIGGEEISKEMRDMFREEAKYIVSSHIWEVINATAINEAGTLALKNSLNFDHVQFAKGLDYWNTLVVKILTALAK